MNDDIKIENGLGFKLTPDDGKLLAVITHCNDRIELTSSLVKKRLQEQQFAHLFISEYLIFELVRRYNNSTHSTFEVEIGELRDSSCDIRLSNDKMKAYLSLTPNFGGKAITLLDVQNLLPEKNIVFGIISTEEIESLLEKGEIVNFIIAQGEESVAGVDTEFKPLVNQVRERKPFINEDGSVDYRELGDIVVVRKDEPLMQRVPPIKGKDGCNVLGEIIMPTSGENISFSVDKSSVYLNPEDKNQLLAAITGQPIMVENGMIVSPVLILDKVDLASGNIRFDGTIVIKGDVLESMKVYALRDIMIDGNVVNSIVECMGNLNIKGGVTGNSQLVSGGEISVKGGVQGYQENKNPDDKHHDAKIIAYRSVSVGFAENFTIEADIDIVIEKYAMNCELLAKNKIVAGRKNSGKKSSLMGGLAWATKLVKATIIGAESGNKTSVKVGVDPFIKKRIDAIRQELNVNEKEQQDILKGLEFIEHYPQKSQPDLLERLHHTLEHLIFNAEAYRAEYKELLSNMIIIRVYAQ